MTTEIKKGDKVRYKHREIAGLEGSGVVDMSGFSATVGKTVYFVRLEAAHREHAPFVLDDKGATKIATGKGTHRAFYAETLERI